MEIKESQLHAEDWGFNDLVKCDQNSQQYKIVDHLVYENGDETVILAKVEKEDEVNPETISRWFTP